MKHRHQKSAIKEWGLLLLVILAAVVPLIGVGFFLLKSADDEVLAERMRSEEREHELMRVTVKEVEDMAKRLHEVEDFELENRDRLEEQLVKFRTYSWLVASVKTPVEWSEYYSEKKRSAEVSQWLLNPEVHEDDLREWLEKGSALYSRAYVLFVLREAGLEDDETLLGLEEGLLWELDEDDESGIILKSGARVRLNTESRMLGGPDGAVGRRGFSFAKSNYEMGIQGMGYEVGLVRRGDRDSRVQKWIEKGDVRQSYLKGGCLLWLLVLVLGLLAYARRRAREARESLDVVSTVAHEFRTPLTGMGLLLERLIDGDLESEKRAEYLEKIEGERGRLERVVEQFLVQGKLRQGNLTIKKYRWAEWVEEEVDRFGELSETGGRFSFIKEAGAGVGEEVYFDRDLLGLALRNLLKNAENYGGEKAIRVSSIDRADAVGCEVSDKGVGMSANLLKRVFGKYERGEEGLARTTEGLGLGLGLVKDIVELHGGRIELESEIGLGTRARFLIPKERRAHE